MREVVLASPGEPWGLVMLVLDASIACLMCTTDASGVHEAATEELKRRAE